ncbi:Dipeptide transport system permease protein DppC [Poriferisphaera corsica]|uniref:Dipeptide transport system permease protein DppC n=1 Tax=Poriferisphaera corsica TaxID=2528020 RepID=A0A517YWR4_9BACT|nr:ABC transporter permease [Poriferisphaera corsica]QDU34678.1 Dipeptide transport system permease protein DppC [Poriferisphaera corsica]
MNKQNVETQSHSRVMTKRRSYIARVVLDTIGRRGAQIGLVWLGMIAVFAVFAPILANSHPFLMKTVDGEITWPFLEYLSAVDIALPLSCVLVIALLFLKKLDVGIRWIAFAVMLAVVWGGSYWLVTPPITVVYDQYRTMDKAGQIEWAYYAPIPFSPTDRLRDLPQERNQAPDTKHWLGTEADGADVLSRMIWASRIAMSIGFIATGISLCIGVVVGGLMGYFSGIFDLIGMRLVEILEAIPQLYLLLTFVAFYGRNLYAMMIIIGITSWSGYARFIRAEFLKLRKMDYVQACHASGLPLSSILFKHMLPNGIAPILVSASFGVASAILAEATLSFLGLGLIDKPSWGQMLNQATGATGGFLWWMAIFPGGAIFLTVFAYNLIGEALRDTIDPYTARQ